MHSSPDALADTSVPRSARLRALSQSLHDSLEDAVGAHAPFGAPQDGRVTLHCPVKAVADVADWLIGMGADRVSVNALAYVFSARNALYERLERRIG